jgi:hypothetical protein
MSGCPVETLSIRYSFHVWSPATDESIRPLPSRADCFFVSLTLFRKKIGLRICEQIRAADGAARDACGVAGKDRAV